MDLPQKPTEEVFHYAFAQVSAGVRPFDVQRQLVENGWEPQTAAFIMNHVRRSIEIPQASLEQVPLPAFQSQPGPNAAFRGSGSSIPSTPSIYPNANDTTSANSVGKKSCIPWGVYRDLVVGGLFLFAGVIMATARIGMIWCIFAVLFGFIQIIRAAIIGALSQYRV